MIITIVMIIIRRNNYFLQIWKWISSIFNTSFAARTGEQFMLDFISSIKNVLIRE